MTSNWFFKGYENMQHYLAYVDPENPGRIVFTNSIWQMVDEIHCEDEKGAVASLKTNGFQQCESHSGFMKLFTIPTSIVEEDWTLDPVFSSGDLWKSC